MKAVRRLLATMAFGVTVTLSAPAALGSPPTGGCPLAFEGPMDFAEMVETWPPPPGVDPTAAFEFYDKDDDGSLCVRPFPDGVRINVVDNAASLP